MRDISNIKINPGQSVHFIGIGGISMSGLALILHKDGCIISGSDPSENAQTRELTSQGIRIFKTQTAENFSLLGYIPDYVVYTAAVKMDNPECAEALRLGICMLSRAELLGLMMKNSGNSLCVAGTHGKTTTTSMLSLIFDRAGADPTVCVGGVVPAFNGPVRCGRSDVFIAEACEYTNSFHSFYPTDAIILNIDADHMDFFKDLDAIYASFKTFAELIPESGSLVINSTIPSVQDFIKGLKCHVYTYGIEDDSCDFVAKNLTHENGNFSFDVCYSGCYSRDAACCSEKTLQQAASPLYTFHVVLALPGRHNVENALAAIAIALLHNIKIEDIVAALASYTGTGRRFEKVGEKNGILVYDDHADHPTEIEASIAAFKLMNDKKKYIVYQVYTHTRLEASFDGFRDALSKADNVVLLATDAAREFAYTPKLTSEDLCNEIKKLGTNAHYFETHDEAIKFLKKNLSTGDMLITMGPGNVGKIGKEFLEA